jgi:hypothetical protein
LLAAQPAKEIAVTRQAQASSHLLKFIRCPFLFSLN